MSAETADEALVTFTIKSSSEAKYNVTLPLSATVLELKAKLSTSDYADLPSERQRLIYSGRVLKDADTLGSYKIKEGHTIHLVRGADSNQRQNPANQGTASNATAQAPANLAAGTGNNPLAGLTGARYAGFAQLPNQNMFGPDGGMGPPPDPEQMIGMMQNPQFASTLNEALQNPQLIDMMIQQNPMLRGMGPQVRQMMQTPEFRRIMTDPEQLRQMARIQRMYPGMMPPGMAGGSNAFPAPGVTDTTPVQDRDSSQQQQPNNPFAALLGGPSAQAGGQAANPFAALFPPTTAHTPTTSPPAASAGQGASASPDTPSATAAAPPFQTAFPFGSPQMMQQMAQMMQSMNPPAGAPDDSQAGAENPFAALLASMNAGGAGAAFPGGWPPAPFGPFGGAPNVPQDTRPPEERYAEQLRQLNDMGFHEFERNVEALRRTGGSVTGAVEYLLTH